ncbi:MAG: nucleotidyltransferase [bacterium]|nr:nucleotidyltransferase [bacterium]
MSGADIYLYNVLQKYSPRNLGLHQQAIYQLQGRLIQWAGGCYLNIFDSGSRAKGTAIYLASDVDYLVSLSSDCNENSGGLKGIFDSLFTTLSSSYQNVRKQNVSVRINLNGLEIDITPARKQTGSTNDHWVYLSKSGSRQQTNIQRHITDVSQSGRTNEIKVLKIWRELNQLDFPSIYLEYLLISNILTGKSKTADSLGNNAFYILNELAKDTSNPLFARIIDPANSNNILSNLLSTEEKNRIIAKAKVAARQTDWKNIVA